MDQPQTEEKTIGQTMQEVFRQAEEGSFAKLQDAFASFSEMRNYPAPNVEYENWHLLGRPVLEAWSEKLLGQAKTVENLIDENAALKQFRPYHEIKSFFYEDIHELETQLKSYGFSFVREDKSNAPAPEFK